MNVAVGRMHVTITLEEQTGERPPEDKSPARLSALERACAHERLRHEMAADQARWALTSQLCHPQRL